MDGKVLSDPPAIEHFWTGSDLSCWFHVLDAQYGAKYRQRDDGSPSLSSMLGKQGPDPVVQTGEASRGSHLLLEVSIGISCMALHWGKPVLVLKLDIRKAFDSVVQARLGGYIFNRIAVFGGRPWEARLWVQLVQGEECLRQTGGRSSSIQQSNGARSGSIYMEDAYLWAKSWEFLQSQSTKSGKNTGRGRAVHQWGRTEKNVCALVTALAQKL